jgi:uncharacterized C2H2 Zn-finger protein
MSITESACSHCGAVLKRGRDHYTRRIAIVDRDRDRVIAFRCPDCGAIHELDMKHQRRARVGSAPMTSDQREA